jgi:hypothetical protein
MHILKLRKTLQLMAAATLLIAVSADGKTKGNHDNNQGNSSPSPTPSNSKKHEMQSTQAKGKSVDLRTTMAQVKWKNGANVVHSEGGAKVIADVKDGKVTDEKGKTLPSHTTPSAIEGECEVCYPSKTNPNVEICYKVKCGVVVVKTPPSKSQY